MRRLKVAILVCLAIHVAWRPIGAQAPTVTEIAASWHILSQAARREATRAPALVPGLSLDREGRTPGRRSWDEGGRERTVGRALLPAILSIQLAMTVQ